MVMGIADPKTKLELGQMLKERGGKFVSFVHPTALIWCRIKPEDGAVIGPYAVFCTEGLSGDFIHLGAGCYVGASAMINRGCTLHSNVAVTRSTHLNPGVELGLSVVLGDGAQMGFFAKVDAGCVVFGEVPDGARVSRTYDGR